MSPSPSLLKPINSLQACPSYQCITLTHRFSAATCVWDWSHCRERLRAISFSQRFGHADKTRRKGWPAIWSIHMTTTNVVICSVRRQINIYFTANLLWLKGWQHTLCMWLWWMPNQGLDNLAASLLSLVKEQKPETGQQQQIMNEGRHQPTISE